MKDFKRTAVKAFAAVVIFSVLCGVVYPFLITGLSQLFFKHKADGSIIEINHVKYGSELLGQKFTGDTYMWGRIMDVRTDTLPGSKGSTAVYAGPSNLSPAGEEYAKLVRKRVAEIKAANPDAKEDKIPADLVTASGSGADPHVSVDAAEYQIPRIAKARGIDEQAVEHIVKKYTTGRFLGIFGEKVVNVLQVNLALDGILK